jgi:DNA-binding transcriptional regulator YdaS (Cro superfamily)
MRLVKSWLRLSSTVVVSASAVAAACVVSTSVVSTWTFSVTAGATASVSAVTSLEPLVLIFFPCAVV